MKVDLAKQQVIDIKQARQSTSFQPKDLTKLLYTPEETYLRDLFENILKDEPKLNLSEDIHLSRPERFLKTLEACKRLVEIKYENNLNEHQFYELVNYCDKVNPLMLQYGMFGTGIRTQTSKEQYDKWYKDVLDFKMLGCYAQTELGHGSSLNNLETTATLDKTTDEWIINSPSLSSAKFWPGALGKFSNHAIVYAQMIIDGKNYGAHGFLTQTRSYEDHSLLKGINLKDIGPKLGYEGMDNGYATFDHVRIPRTNMLMGFSRVDKLGNYTRPPHSKIGYAIMTQTRVSITRYSAISLARAITIAIRYSTVRRQGTSSKEPQVIDYPLVQYRLLPILATTYSLMFTAHWMKYTYNKMMDQIKNNNDFKLLPEVHAISSALKGYCSESASNLIEEARRCLGGQGYLKASGLSEYYNSFIPSMTYEGENGILTQQTARYLLKQYKLVNKGEFVDITKTSSYIQKYSLLSNNNYQLDVNQLEKDQDFIKFIDAFAYRAYYLLNRLYQNSLISEWEQLSLECFKLTKAHAQYLSILFNWNAIKMFENKQKTSSEIIKALKSLLAVYIISTMDKNANDFYEAGIIVKDDIYKLNQYQSNVFKQLRPNLIALVDAFEFSDRFLASDLGVYDGNVYEKLVESLDHNPLNTVYSKNDVIINYKDTIQPLVHGHVKRAYEKPSLLTKGKL